MEKRHMVETPRHREKLDWEAWQLFEADWTTDGGVLTRHLPDGTTVRIDKLDDGFQPQVTLPGEAPVFCTAVPNLAPAKENAFACYKAHLVLRQLSLPVPKAMLTP
jgi:hypothetical protein